MERFVTYLAPCIKCWAAGRNDSMHEARILKSVKYVTCHTCGYTQKLEFESDEASARRNKKRRAQRRKR